MSRPDSDKPPVHHPELGRSLDRFGPTVRWVHWLTGGLMIVCILSAAILYNGSLAVLVGHRYVVETIHVFSGFALPVAPLVGLVSRAYREDARLLNRFSDRDWAWLRSSSRRDGTIEVDKFNAGQKLNASLSTGATGALLLSGIVMYFTGLADLSWRSGATFVHDWFSLGLGLLVVGHIVYAVRDRSAMTGMRHGRVPLSWARREHAAWARELAGPPSSTVFPAPPVVRED